MINSETLLGLPDYQMTGITRRPAGPARRPGLRPRPYGPASIYLVQGRKELVPSEVDQALKANPNNQAAHLLLPFKSRTDGDYERAIQQARKIAARWPLFWPARMNLAELLREQGDLPGAARELDRVLESDPENRIALGALAHIHMDAGELLKARQVLEHVDARHRGSCRIRIAWALLLALEDKKAEGQREMDGEVQTWAGTSDVNGPVWAAEFYALVGETDKALEWLDRAVCMGDDREE